MRITTTSAEHLELDAKTLEEHPQNGMRVFPDGEVYVQLPEVEDMEEATVVHSGQPDPNRDMMELYGLLSLLQEHGVSTDVLFTYMPYGMQDKAFYDGTLNYARSICRTLVSCFDVDTIHVMDAHFSERDWVEEFPLEILHTFPLIKEHVDMEDYVVIGPDTGAEERFGIEGFAKERTSAYDVAVSGDFDVEGRNVLVFDDIIETGGTMVAACEGLREQGAERIEAAAVHGVMDDGVGRVKDAFDALHLTNTIRSTHANVSVEPMIEDVLDA